MRGCLAPVNCIPIISIARLVPTYRHLAHGLHLFYAIHDFGFPGWPEPNLDWDSGYRGVRSI